MSICWLVVLCLEFLTPSIKRAWARLVGVHMNTHRTRLLVTWMGPRVAWPECQMHKGRSQEAFYLFTNNYATFAQILAVMVMMIVVSCPIFPLAPTHPPTHPIPGGQTSLQNSIAGANDLCQR